jgi:hypothetical protein
MRLNYLMGLENFNLETNDTKEQRNSDKRFYLKNIVAIPVISFATGAAIIGTCPDDYQVAGVLLAAFGAFYQYFSFLYGTEKFG